MHKKITNIFFKYVLIQRFFYNRDSLYFLYYKKMYQKHEFLLISSCGPVNNKTGKNQLINKINQNWNIKYKNALFIDNYK